MSESLDELAALAGIAPEYRDYWERTTTVSDETKRALLDAMGYAVDGDRETEAELARAHLAPWLTRIEPVAVVREGAGASLICARPLPVPEPLHWTLALEDGTRRHGSMVWADLELAASRTLAGRTFERRVLALGTLPLGYHHLAVHDGEVEISSTIVIVPHACYLPAEMEHAKVWALATQLYALRSERNWGIGDFTDLQRLAGIVEHAGGGAIGLNPLHQLHLHNPQAASPYAPSSRLFLNTLYIDVTAIPDYAESAEAGHLVATATFQDRLEALRAASLVDYGGVAEVKREVLALLYAAFRRNHLAHATERAMAFAAFVRDGGSALERLATYEALAEHFRARDDAAYGWQQWPPAYRNPESDAVAAFALEHPDRVEFFAYLQWVADEQLAQAAAAGAGLARGLYRDLAVGVDLNSADAWSDQRTILAGASLGAPADPLNALGQNWGLPPISPIALRAAAYAPFAALLRGNMRHAGILRIDHVMALARCFWIPRGASARAGAYVHYNLEDMLGIVALESVRNRCVVVGEDLGTVPETLRARLRETRIFSSRLVYFERNWETGAFLAPETYPYLAAASIGTHDLPTLAGWWLGDDIALRVRISLYPDDAAAREAGEDRWAARFALIDALESAGALDNGGADRLREDARHNGSREAVAELAVAVHRFLRKTPAALVVVAIEDLLGELDAVNVPGTVDEHPNWHRKRSQGLEALRIDDTTLEEIVR